MECVFGFLGDGFALVVADTLAVQSIVVQKSTEDKIMVLDSHKLLGCTGESGDRVQFCEFIQKNVNLYLFRNGISLSTSAAANFTRGELAIALRKSPYQVNIMMAGFDGNEPSLYYLDYIATLHKLEKGALGYEMKTRLVAAPLNFVIKIVDKDGARELAWRKSFEDNTGTE